MTIAQFSIKHKNKKLLSEMITTLFILSLILILLLNPVHYAQTFLKGLMLFASSVLPGLFPFMLLTRILTSLGFIQKLSNKLEKPMRKLFNSPGIASYCLIMSNLSGYPIGAKIVGDLYTNDYINDNEAKNILTYSMTSGPVFVIGTVGGIILGNIKAGIIIFISHIISNIFTGLLFCNLRKSKILKKQNKIQLTTSPQSFDKIMSDSMYSSVQSLLIVGGFISVFYCFSEILLDLHILEILSFPLSSIFRLIGINPNISLGVMSGITEVTRGIKDLSFYFNSYPILISSLACSIISFSGLSIILQSKAFLNHTKIKTHFLIFSKSVHAILSFITCIIISSIFM